MHSPDTKALEQICGDMDDMESKKMFDPKEPEGTPKGVSITIDVAPKTDEPEEEKPEPEEMNKGGMVDDEMKLPPFLRTKKC